MGLILGLSVGLTVSSLTSVLTGALLLAALSVAVQETCVIPSAVIVNVSFAFGVPTPEVVRPTGPQSIEETLLPPVLLAFADALADARDAGCRRLAAVRKKLGVDTTAAALVEISRRRGRT